jgi:hypothetical protein
LSYSIDTLDNGYTLKRPDGTKIISITLHQDFEEWEYDQQAAVSELLVKFRDIDASYVYKKEEM